MLAKILWTLVFWIIPAMLVYDVWHNYSGEHYNKRCFPGGVIDGFILRCKNGSKESEDIERDS